MCNLAGRGVTTRESFPAQGVPVYHGNPDDEDRAGWCFPCPNRSLGARVEEGGGRPAFAAPPSPAHAVPAGGFRPRSFPDRSRQERFACGSFVVCPGSDAYATGCEARKLPPLGGALRPTQPCAPARGAATVLPVPVCLLGERFVPIDAHEGGEVSQTPHPVVLF